MGAANPRSERPPDAGARIAAAIPVTLLVSAIAITASGVARKEACSAAVGSVESSGEVYSPCDTIGLSVVIALAAIALIAVVGVVTTPRVRRMLAAVSIALVAVLLIGGYSALTLP